MTTSVQTKAETFTGATLEETLELVHRKWGPDAVVLHVRRVSGPKPFFGKARQSIEVTAHAPLSPAKDLVGGSTSVTSEEYAGPESVAPQSDPVLTDEAPSHPLHQVLAGLRSELHGVNATIRQMERIQWARSHLEKRALEHPLLNFLEARGIPSEDALELMAEWSMKEQSLDIPKCMADLDRRMKRTGWDELFPSRRGSCTLFMGLPGAGKTLLLLKVAAQLKMNRNFQVMMISADMTRPGPTQELSLYGEILGVEVRQVFNLTEVAEAIKDVPEQTHILVDWNGISPFDEESWSPLKQFADAHPHSQILLTASLVTDLNIWKMTSNRWKHLPMAGLALTQADLETRMGKIWQGVSGTNLPLAFLSTGKNVPGDVMEGRGIPFSQLLFQGYQGDSNKMAKETALT